MGESPDVVIGMRLLDTAQRHRRSEDLRVDVTVRRDAISSRSGLMFLPYSGCRAWWPVAERDLLDDTAFVVRVERRA